MKALLYFLLILPIQAHAFDSVYIDINILGWTVKISEKLAQRDSALCYETISVLVKKLKEITDVIPEQPLRELQKIPIWIENESPNPRAMWYHISPEWLRDNGLNPAKAGGAEVSNPSMLSEWLEDQPLMIFHELAHGYHHRFLGLRYPPLERAFQSADSLKLYRNPRRRRGDGSVHDAPEKKAYAMENTHEYFAELSEAYFGVNDWYPFTRKQLKEYDPEGYAMIRKAWMVEALPE